MYASRGFSLPIERVSPEAVTAKPAPPRDPSESPYARQAQFVLDQLLARLREDARQHRFHIKQNEERVELLESQVRDLREKIKGIKPVIARLEQSQRKDLKLRVLDMKETLSRWESSLRECDQRIDSSKAVIKQRQELLAALESEWQSDPVITRLRQEEREDFEAGLHGDHAKAPSEKL